MVVLTRRALVIQLMCSIQRTRKLYGRYRTKNMIPPDAADKFAFEKKVDIKKACAIVATPYTVKNVKINTGFAFFRICPY